MSEPLFNTCESVGICDRTKEPHWFYWDGERDTERMDEIHEHGKGHDDPMSNYGAVECKHCGRKALVLHDSEDFPEV